MDMQVCCASQHTEGGDETKETETMITMQMGDKDVSQPSEVQLVASELDLCSLTAVYHVELFAYVEHLGGVEVPGGGECRTASENVQVKFFHGNEFVFCLYMQ